MGQHMFRAAGAQRPAFNKRLSENSRPRLASDGAGQPRTQPATPAGAFRRRQAWAWVFGQSLSSTPVSEADAETLRRSYEALNRGDARAALDALDPHAVWRESPELPGGAELDGRDAVLGFPEDFLAQ